ncbi:type II secretory pathway, component HofQ [Rubidibacter lacunae KORDI 51-2]|uniref:Type II secretory pathway, component HofQ n=1 Tax=Rubidibacter lacunae KORDI 51-2 TaxID=582515 RepID=U5DTN5_9CHRO|nr:secretin and TonB N-terminal domain-containing protein [Rubidibacter lacunae]ERN43035.1 type II secretory pathway, component HofQ [Rubidibacter lacunae KORDI 51-2]
MKRPYQQLATLLGAAVLAAPPLAASARPLQQVNGFRQQHLLVQAANPQVLFPNPGVTIDGQPALSNATGVRVTPVRPTRPRAVAPPVGDMAVSTIDTSPAVVDLGTSVRVPRLVLREAPVREVLSLLARSANLNLVFSGEGGDEGTQTISVDLEDESVQEAFNAMLQLSGLQANRRGRTIFVSTELPAAARNLIARSYRLNQVDAGTAATFLATQGAAVQILEQLEEQVIDPETQRIVRTILQPPDIRPLTARQPDEAGVEAPLLLQGLTVTTDERLNSLTLIGETRIVEIATGMLTQLDARRRQVAVNVKIVDVNLAGMQNFSSSFSFAAGDTFVVSDEGNAVINFGRRNPPSAASAVAPGAILPPITGLGLGDGASIQPFFDFQGNAPFGDVTFAVPEGTTSGAFPPGVFARPNFGTNANPLQPGISGIEPDGRIRYSPPGLLQTPDRFLALIQAQITSGNAKILTDPTLVVQEGQESTVRLVQDVITSVTTEVDTESGVRTVTPLIGEAGLVLNVNIERIDDNGFVSMSVTPVISTIADIEEFDSGFGTDNLIALLARREVSSGLIRMRDGQTLILTGIIQDSEVTTVSKWPILGDLPIIGALFRSSNTDTQRDEVVVLVTPQVMDDSLDAGYGYGYTPGPDARQLLQQQGFPPVPPNVGE